MTYDTKWDVRVAIQRQVELESLQEWARTPQNAPQPTQVVGVRDYIKMTPIGLKQLVDGMYKEAHRWIP